MNRRKAIKIFGSGLTIPTIPHISGSCNKLDEGAPDIKIFQTKRFAEAHKEGYTESGAEAWLKVMKNNISVVLERDFDVSVRTKVQFEPVDTLFSNPLGSTFVGDRIQRNARWSFHGSESEDIARQSNILLDVSTDRVGDYGYGWIDVINSECFHLDSFATVWLPIDLLTEESFFYPKQYIEALLLHEIGHNLGLTHSHATVFDGDPPVGSVMYSNDFAKDNEVNRYGEQMPKDLGRSSKFNERLSREDVQF